MDDEMGPKTNDNCGGSPVDYIGKCSKLTPMCTKRAWASSIVLNKISKSESLEKSGSTYFEYLLRNNESEILWITGGMQQNRHPHSSTEFVTLSESQLFSRIIGPELPFTIYQHCMIEYGYNAILLLVECKMERDLSKKDQSNIPRKPGLLIQPMVLKLKKDLT